MYHINPQKGPKICRARKGNCPYGAEAPHFETFDEAMQSYNSHLSNLNVFSKKSLESGVSNTVYQPIFHYTSKRNVFTNDLKKLDDDLAGSDVAMIEEYISNNDAYDDVKKLIGARSFKSINDRERLTKINPRGGVAGAEVSEKVYKELIHNYNNYNNHTGVLMDALNSHPKSLNYLSKLEHDVKIGEAVMVNGKRNFANSELIGLVALKEYSNDFKPFDSLKLNSLLENKNLYGDFNESVKINSGMVYRENVMKKFALINYAETSPLKIYENDNYYANIKEPKQIVKPLAFTSSGEDNAKPNGIFEIVKSKSNGEISLKDKANILYTLDTLEFDKAFVRAINGENKYFDTIINRNDDLYKGVKIKDFINDKIKPLTNDV